MTGDCGCGGECCRMAKMAERLDLISKGSRQRREDTEVHIPLTVTEDESEIAEGPMYTVDRSGMRHLRSIARQRASDPSGKKASRALRSLDKARKLTEQRPKNSSSRPRDSVEMGLPLGYPKYPQGPTVDVAVSTDAATKPPAESPEYYEHPAGSDRMARAPNSDSPDETPGRPKGFYRRSMDMLEKMGETPALGSAMLPKPVKNDGNPRKRPAPYKHIPGMSRRGVMSHRQDIPKIVEGGLKKVASPGTVERVVERLRQRRKDRAAGNALQALDKSGDKASVIPKDELVQKPHEPVQRQAKKAGIVAAHQAGALPSGGYQTKEHPSSKVEHMALFARTGRAEPCCISGGALMKEYDDPRAYFEVMHQAVTGPRVEIGRLTMYDYARLRKERPQITGMLKALPTEEAQADQKGDA